jgi:hypothetical protein
MKNIIIIIIISFALLLKLKEHLWKYNKLAPKQQQQNCPKLPLVILYLLADIK